jgi:hypothetical protein
MSIVQTPADPSSGLSPAGDEILKDGLQFSSVIEIVSKVSEAFVKLLAATSAVAFVAGNLFIGRYLGAFGQPGPSSFGQIIDYLPIVLLLMVAVVVVFVVLVGMPMLVRPMLDTRDAHAFGGGVNHDRQSSCSQAMAYVASMAGYGWILLAGVIPERWELAGFGAAVAIGCLISLGWAWRKALTSEVKARRWAYLGRSLWVVFGANLMLFVWVAVLTDPVRNSLHGYWGGAVSVDVTVAVAVGLLISLYSLMTVCRWKAAAAVALLAGLVLVGAVGDRALVGFALRTANLGGGVPIVYRQAEIGVDDRSIKACLVFAAGDTRIVWIPPVTEASTSSDEPPVEPCDFGVFKHRLQQGGLAWDAGRFQNGDDVRVFKRTDFYDPF